MTRKAVLALSLSLCLMLWPGAAAAHDSPRFQPGAPGIGDPYFPLDGNGGYDVGHYLLDVRYAPQTDRLTGVATISARATQHLSRFNLDLVGLTVRSITVDGKPARWSRSGDELTVTPRHGLRKGSRFTTVVRYDGVPTGLEGAGFLHTDDGTLVIGEPHVAASWFPVNDHPIDKAAYTFKIAVPDGLEAVANGELQGRSSKHGWTTWTWHAKEPMAAYLTTATIGQFNLDAYRKDGIKFTDAIDPDLMTPVAAPRTGSGFAVSQVDDTSYKRLARTITVPAGGAELSFWITRATEQGWDFAFIEAHTVGQDDWTTLPDRNGHTSQSTGDSCPSWHALHPFLTHYQTANPDGSCAPRGSSGQWHAASGASSGYEQWAVDLAAFAGKQVEVSISYASDEVVQLQGLFVDDVVVSPGAGSTSFEADADPLDGWTVPGAPAGSTPNPNDWKAGSAADVPAPTGEVVRRSFARQAEIIRFLESKFGPYPFSASGGIVDDLDGIGFALENQTRPIYAKTFFGDTTSGADVIAHELAHQWYGDSLAVARWQHIWLNEGFATYAQWLWSEHEGNGTTQELFDSFYAQFPPTSQFWQVKIGDPGPGNLFNFAVYARGAMTLHQLRLAVGDADFFRILRRWTASKSGGNVATPEFIALAERISGQQLDALFDTWLFTTGRPTLPGARASAGTVDPRTAPITARLLLKQRR